MWCENTEIKEIPILHNLQVLWCSNTEIKEIPILPNLQVLWSSFGYYCNKEEIQIFYKQQHLQRRLLHLWKIYKLKN